jgi:CRISPR-associated protein Cmr2
MTEHVLLVTLGPVQGFIAQARRTRDLWYGSHLLSELSRAAARALIHHRATLVFPALSPGDPELEPCHQLSRNTGDPPQAIPNKLLALTPDGADPAAIARAVRAAVQGYWQDEIAEKVRQRCGGLVSNDIDEVWREQVETFLEFTAAWAPADDFAAARKAVAQAVDGRKLLRDFPAWEWQRGAVPNSSLDGARKTVLRLPQARDKRLAARFRIAESENLDAVGLIKRAGGEPDQFVPTVNVAVADWLEQAQQTAPSEFQDLVAAAGEIRLSRITSGLPCAQPFRFDASIFFPDRWNAVFEEQALSDDPQQWGTAWVSPVLEKAGTPSPYVAFLVADGDRVGKALDGLKTKEALHQFSHRLAAFPAIARSIVEQSLGALIYSGGDDVLAMLPVARAVDCADALRREFAKTMDTAGLPAGTERPTLSVGIGIGHVMESMGDLLNLAREAEREAKKERNSLAIIVDRRSGGRRVWASPWTDDPKARLSNDASLLRGKLSNRKVYEVASILRRLPAPSTAAQGSEWAALLCGEVRRALARSGEEGMTLEEASLALSETDYAASYAEVERWVNRLLVASFLGAADRSRSKVAP